MRLKRHIATSPTECCASPGPGGSDQQPGPEGRATSAGVSCHGPASPRVSTNTRIPLLTKEGPFEAPATASWCPRCENDRVSSAAKFSLGAQPVDSPRLADILRSYAVVELAGFGSVGRGEAEADRDVDLLYTLIPDRMLAFTIDHFEDELADLFGLRFDLVSKKATNRLPRGMVIAEAETLYAA